MLGTENLDGIVSDYNDDAVPHRPQQCLPRLGRRPVSLRSFCRTCRRPSGTSRRSSEDVLYLEKARSASRHVDEWDRHLHFGWPDPRAADPLHRSHLAAAKNLTQQQLLDSALATRTRSYPAGYSG